MSYLRIHCNNCGGNWEIYELTYNKKFSNICPHCLKEIDKQLWNQIYLAFQEVCEVNRELYKAYLGFPDTSLFSIEVLSDYEYRKENMLKRGNEEDE